VTLRPIFGLNDLSLAQFQFRAALVVCFVALFHFHFPSPFFGCISTVRLLIGNELNFCDRFFVVFLVKFGQNFGRISTEFLAASNRIFIEFWQNFPLNVELFD